MTHRDPECETWRYQRYHTWKNFIKKTFEIRDKLKKTYTCSGIDWYRLKYIWISNVMGEIGYKINENTIFYIYSEIHLTNL